MAEKSPFKNDRIGNPFNRKVGNTNAVQPKKATVNLFNRLEVPEVSTNWQEEVYGPVLNALMNEEKKPTPHADWLNSYLAGGKKTSWLDDYLADTPSGNIKPVNGLVRGVDEELNLDALNPEMKNVYLEDLTPRAITPQELFQQAMRMRQEQGREAVNLRKIQQEEMGMRSRYPSQEQASAIDDSVRARLRQAMLPQPQIGGRPIETRALPGVGNVAMYPQGERTVTGRYGVGSAVNAAPKERFIMEGGKKVNPTQWFQDAARRQGQSNKYANKEGRKIVDDEKVA